MSTLRLASRLSVLGSLVAFGIACGGSSVSVGSDQSAQKGGDGGAADGSTPPGDAKGASCVTDSDCGPAGTGNLCGFDEKLACAATGTCFDVGNVAVCEAYSPGCACDGTAINVACSPLPQGYASKPLLHAGACVAAGGGTGSCTTSNDCKPGDVCGFPEVDLCAAKGTCFPAPGATCAAFSPGCACDGTAINTICNGLPNGYETKPFAHAGTCNDAGP